MKLAALEGPLAGGVGLEGGPLGMDLAEAWACTVRALPACAACEGW